MSDSSIYLDRPSRSILRFPPDPYPESLPPPPNDHTLRSPFTISAETYNFWLQPTVPLTFAAIYATTIISINAYNRRHGNQPWRISQTKTYYYLVLLHNIFLMLYSALTCVAMVDALRHIWPSYGGYDYKLPEAIDALCKMHGPRGMGDAAFYNATTNQWNIKNNVIHLADNGGPDPTDVGRLWNEGLAFWGWWFYLSKFYEVIDSFIIVMKGKKSSTLQIYHHAGAMAAMWSGIRYMSPPIWMFVTVNSFIHTWMYGYYTASALGFRVPLWFKRTLTTCQILQFVVGASYAAAHLFVSYSVPVVTPYIVYSNVVRATTAAVTAVPSSVSSAVSSAVSTASTDPLSFLKKLALRAAGEEGLAEKVGHHRSPVEETIHTAEQQVLEPVMETVQEIRYRNEFHKVNCIDTSGEAFAIYLNLVYLFPLTGLFVRFFIRSYTKRMAKSPVKQRKPFSSRGQAAVEASQDAAREVDESMDRAERRVSDAVERDLTDLINSKKTKESMQAWGDRAKNVPADAKETLKKAMPEVDGSFDEKMKKAQEVVKESVKGASEKVLATPEKVSEDIQRRIQELRGRQDAEKARSNEVEETKDEKESEKSTNHNAGDSGASHEASKDDGTDKAPITNGEDREENEENEDEGGKAEEKENEVPKENKPDGDTQPNSMATSQTVSDLDSSYADVLKEDSKSTKSKEESGSGESES
ncbi:MAG: hypothetical protein M1820_002300 [Bogoriella megaspora]|nr:MAG: hypothetical protein M1820_002300 [Bogoriella megaspora]